MKLRNAWMAAALALAVSTATTTPVQADTTNPDPIENAAEIRVVNNHMGAVGVYTVDQQNQRMYLGAVNRTQFKSFTLPAGTLRLQVLPLSAPAGLGVRESQISGIETLDVDLEAGQAVELWLEPGLSGSTAHLRGD